MDPAHLQVVRDDGVELVELDRGQLTLGRAHDSSLAFPTDSTLSKHHAVISFESGDWSVSDVGSTNGTFVNGVRVTSQRLRPGDEITVGSQRLIYHAGPVGLDQDTRTDGMSVTRPDEPVSHPRAGSAPAGYLDAGEEWAAPQPAPQTAPRRRPGPDPPVPTPARPAAYDDTRPTRPARDDRRSGRGQARGVARDVQVRKVQKDQEALDFRLDRYDASGNRLPSVAVRFSSYRGGQVSDGEEVQVTGTYKRGTLHARSIVNLSTQAQVHGAPKWEMIVSVVAVVLVLSFILWIAVTGFLSG